MGIKQRLGGNERRISSRNNGVPMNRWEVFRKSIPALLVGLGILAVGVPCFAFMFWTLSPEGVIDIPDFMFKMSIGCAVAYCVFLVPIVFKNVKQGKTLFSRKRDT